MTTDFDVLMEVNDLLYFPASPENVKKALQKLARRKGPMFASFRAKALVLSGKAEDALVAADEAIKTSSSSWAHFWRAAALVMQGAPATQWAEALKVAYKGDADCAAEAMRQPAFEPVRSSAEFLAALGRKKNSPKASPEVTKLVKLAKGGDPFALWKAASKLGKHADQPSVTDALVHGLNGIVEDLDEHGDANLDEYGGKKPDFFVAELKKAKAARKAHGKARSAFVLALEVA